MRSRGLFGYLFGLVGFVAICIAALLSPWGPETRFSGLVGIQDDLTDKVETVLTANEVASAQINVDGRDVNVTLGASVGDAFHTIEQQLQDQDGVGLVTLTDGPATSAAEGDDPSIDPAGDQSGDIDEPAAQATATAVPPPEPTNVVDPAPEPTAAPTVDPAPEPTAAPTVTPAPTATTEPAIFSAVDAVAAGLDTSDVEFAVGQATLTETEGLDEIAAQLQNVSQGQLEVQVHTDNAGDPDVNQLLSEERAQVVTDYLVSQGVAESVLVPRGYGGSQPIADNSTEQGRRNNERVVLVVEGN